ncbi:MAG: hypothetical protein ACLFRP_04695 [Puniceicoccaceae bacterium]
MDETPDSFFSAGDRASLVRWIRSRGGNGEQAEFAARQLMKRAVRDAADEGIAPIEAMGRILEKIARAERVFRESAEPGSPETGPEPPKSPKKGG